MRGANFESTSIGNNSTLNTNENLKTMEIKLNIEFCWNFKSFQHSYHLIITKLNKKFFLNNWKIFRLSADYKLIGFDPKWPQAWNLTRLEPVKGYFDTVGCKSMGSYRIGRYSAAEENLRLLKPTLNQLYGRSPTVE